MFQVLGLAGPFSRGHWQQRWWEGVLAKLKWEKANSNKLREMWRVPAITGGRSGWKLRALVISISM